VNRHSATGLVLLTVLALALGACTVTTNSFPPSASAPGDSFGPPDPDATLRPPVTIDRSLLAFLPRSVDSIPVIESSEGNDTILADDVLPLFASAAVAAEIASPQTADVATVFVVRLLPGAMTDDVFRDWRDSFDAGVCAGDNQVVGRAEADVAGNHVYIGTCATADLRTYHVWLKDKSILISSWSTGERRLGLLVLENLPQ
jgi:hypothetical protein